MAELTEEQIKEIVKKAKILDESLTRYMRHEESFDLTAGAGTNIYGGSVVKPDRILVVTLMFAYDADNAPTYIRLGYWNRTRNVWVKIEPAPLVLETVMFVGEMFLQEGMYPLLEVNGATAGDDLHGGVHGYWVRAPRIS